MLSATCQQDVNKVFTISYENIRIEKRFAILATVVPEMGSMP
jgi:hypothetical protein